MAIYLTISTQNQAARKLVSDAMSFIASESYPNGNGGPNDGQVRFFQDTLEEFRGKTKITVRGDAYTVGARVSVLPNKFTYKELKRLKDAMNKFKIIAALEYDWRQASQYREWILGGDAPSEKHIKLLEAYASGATPEACVKQMNNYHLGEVYSTACVAVLKWGEFEGRVDHLRLSVFAELLGEGVFLTQERLRTPNKIWEFEELPCVMIDGSISQPGEYLYRRTVKLDGTVL